MKKYFCTILFLALTNLLNAQVTQQWVVKYNGPENGDDEVSGMVVDAAGDIYVTGSSVDYFATVKYNSSGIEQWVARYNGTASGFNMPYCITVDGSGNIYVTGVSHDFGSGDDYATIKYNSSGIQQWVTIYNGCDVGNISQKFDYATSITFDASGNVYVTGYSSGGYGPTGTRTDIATIKYNSSGTQQWVQRYDAGYDEYGNSIAVDASGNVYVTGTISYGRGTHYLDYLTIKYNSAGDEQWVQTYDGPASYGDQASKILIDISGNVYITGCSAGNYIPGVGPTYGYATIKYNSLGEQLWLQRFEAGLPNDQYVAQTMALDPSGNIIITTEGLGISTGYNYSTIKYSSSGTEQWIQTYNGPVNGLDQPNNLVVDAYGNCYITGQSAGSGDSVDIATVKYSSSGIQKWVVRYSTGNNWDYSRAPSLAVDFSNNIYVAVQCYSEETDYDYVIIKYSQSLPLTAPGLVDPPNNAMDMSLTPTLDWNDVMNAASYTIQVSDNNTFSSLIFSQTGNTTSQVTIPANTFTNNVIYYWRVNATNGSGTGPWSEVWSFRTFSTPLQKTQMEVVTVDSLVTATILNQGEGNSLDTKLNYAIEKINQGQIQPAINKLNAFKNEVQALINSRRLTQTQGQNLIGRTDETIQQLNGHNSVENIPQIPSEFKLYSNYPNPFNPTTKIKFDIPDKSVGLTSLYIYNVIGQKIKTLINDKLEPGTYEVEWNASNYSSGIYFYELKTNLFNQTKKMVLIK